MTNRPPRGIFIAGTDTEVGKTYVTSLLAKRLVSEGKRVGVYKPAASDCIQKGEELFSTDADKLWRAAGQPLTLNEVCPQRFLAPLAPHLAARLEGKKIDVQLLREGLAAWHGHCDIVLVEGIGGLMSPVSDDEFVADLAFDFGYPLIVVASNTLGVINQTLQTLITASTFRDGLDVVAVVLNDASPGKSDVSRNSNYEQIESRIIPPVLGHVGHGSDGFPHHPNLLDILGF